MTQFTIPEWRKKQIERKFKRRDSVAHRTVLEMEVAMKRVVDAIVDYGYRSGEFHAPSNFDDMYHVTERFYRNVIQNAFDDCDDQKDAQKGKKRLAFGPIGIPRRAKRFADFFKNNRYWKSVMKRSRFLTDRLKRQYLEKLKKKFTELVPFITLGQASPQDVKKKMMEAWDASKARVETIFRTETTTYFEKSQVEFFKGENEIIGMLFDSVDDSSCTDICKSRHGMVYKPEYTGQDSISYNCPSCHYGCRSHFIPLANTSENRKIVDDPRRNPIKHRSKIKPLPSGWR